MSEGNRLFATSMWLVRQTILAEVGYMRGDALGQRTEEACTLRIDVARAPNDAEG